MFQVKVIAEVISSAPDSFGNSYHCARITSTRTGQGFDIVKIADASNVTGALKDLFGWYPAVFAFEREVRTRTLDWIQERMEENDNSLKKLTAEDLKAALIKIGALTKQGKVK